MLYEPRQNMIDWRRDLGSELLKPIPNDCISARSARRYVYLIGAFVTICMIFQFLITN